MAVKLTAVNRTHLAKSYRWAATFAGIGILALLLLCFAVPRLIPSRWLAPRLEGLLGQALGTPVRIAEAQATSLLPLTIAVRAVTLGEDHPEAPLTGTVRYAEFGVGWLNLWRRRPSFTHLLLTEADLRLGNKAQAGRPAAGRMPGAALAAVALQHRPDVSHGTAFTIAQLQVQNSRLQWTETPLVFERLETEGQVHGWEVSLGRTTATWLGGTLDASAIRLTFAPTHLGFAVTGRLMDVAVEQLTRAPEKPALTGRGTFRLDVTGQYTYAAQGFDHLGGSGDAALRDGQLTQLRLGVIGQTFTLPSLPAPIGSFVLGAAGEQGPGAAASRAGSPPSTEGLDFQQLAFRFALDGSTIKLDGLTCDLAEGQQVTGRGMVSLAERPVQIDFDLQFPLILLTGGSRLRLLDTLGARQMVPVRVTGTFERPVVEIVGLHR